MPLALLQWGRRITRRSRWPGAGPEDDQLTDGAPGSAVPIGPSMSPSGTILVTFRSSSVQRRREMARAIASVARDLEEGFSAIGMHKLSIGRPRDHFNPPSGVMRSGRATVEIDGLVERMVSDCPPPGFNGSAAEQRRTVRRSPPPLRSALPSASMGPPLNSGGQGSAMFLFNISSLNCNARAAAATAVQA